MLELLMVIIVISLLAAMLFPVFGKVRNKARKTAAQAEVRNIETALKQYYAEYQKWPTNILDNTATNIAYNLADMLQGDNPNGSNPKQFQFMQFSRFDVNTNPISPWTKPGSAEDSYAFYYVKCSRYGNKILGTDSTTNPPNSTVRKKIIVWTYDPTDNNKVIGTWKQ